MDEGHGGPGVKGNIDRMVVVVEGKDLTWDGGEAVEGWGRVKIMVRRKLKTLD
jgi:hypothetical protein